jgi:hypothetical protein
MTPEPNNNLITTETDSLIQIMDQRLDLLSRVLKESEEKNQENAFLESFKEWSEPIVREIRLTKNGFCWGILEICNDNTVTIKSQKDGFPSAILHITAAAAFTHLDKSDKKIFNLWAGLPEYEWNELHYSEFAFSFLRWLSIPNSFFDNSEKLSKTQKWLNESGDLTWETNEFNDAVTDVFVRMFKEMPF